MVIVIVNPRTGKPGGFVSEIDGYNTTGSSAALSKILSINIYHPILSRVLIYIFLDRQMPRKDVAGM